VALTFTYRSSIYSTTAAATYTAAPTYTPAANSLLIAFVGGALASSPTDPTGVTGHGLTFTKLTLTANLLSTTHALSVWVANSGASPTSVACVATWGSNRTGGWVIEFESTGADVSGGAAAAIVQNPTNTGTATSGSVSLAAAGNALNRPIAFWCHLANEATTPKASPAWTETTGADGNFNNPATGAEGEFIASEWDGAPTASWTTSSAWRGIALEVKATIPPAITGTGNLNTSFSEAGTGKLGFIATAALAFSFVTAGAGVEKFLGTGGVPFTHSQAATGSQGFVGSGDLPWPFSIAATGEVEVGPITGSGNLSFTHSQDGVGVEKFAGSGELSHPFSLVGAGIERFTGFGNLDHVFSLAGGGTVEGEGQPTPPSCWWWT